MPDKFTELSSENLSAEVEFLTTAPPIEQRVSDLYARLGGIGNPDARLVRGLYAKLQQAEKDYQAANKELSRIGALLSEIAAPSKPKATISTN